ncbi:MAG: hypothetical protein OXT69_06625 [Candidatus Poribacteria bacterium]|nr:hypothetical protein [Candidatus Poribacteria bacterium]
MRRTLNALTTKLAGRVKPFLNIPTALMTALAVGGFGLSLWMVEDSMLSMDRDVLTAVADTDSDNDNATFEGFLVKAHVHTDANGSVKPGLIYGGSSSVDAGANCGVWLKGIPILSRHDFALSGYTFCQTFDVFSRHGVGGEFFGEPLKGSLLCWREWWVFADGTVQVVWKWTGYRGLVIKRASQEVGVVDNGHSANSWSKVEITYSSPAPDNGSVKCDSSHGNGFLQ